MIGIKIGNLNISEAKRIYYVILSTSFLIISFITFLVLIFKDFLLKNLTNIEGIYNAANKIIYLLVFNTFP
jgi:Na+-driven multidrug efflux pump